MDSIHGVDINPFAVAVARFRLLLRAMKAGGIKRLKDCPELRQKTFSKIKTYVLDTDLVTVNML
ncbi:MULTISPECIES: hypothetical protein [Desulfococcus]|uniref:hypothetical protein n=1 Tax=Desulfococcus TaxID=896 RepID=UPI00059001EB|nr:hypothetical protein [Desulfococcus multivorans]AQU99423.1 hypothetical protein B2D07_00550 [Desulfococcus multivorans]